MFKKISAVSGDELVQSILDCLEEAESVCRC